MRTASILLVALLVSFVVCKSESKSGNPGGLPTTTLVEEPNSDPRSLNGWGGVRWGMYESEAEAAISASRHQITQRIKNEKGEPVWVLDSHDIDGVKFETRMIFSGSPKPSAVTVSFVCPQEAVTSNQYDRIETLLLKELGNTTTIDHADMTPEYIRREVIWSFPATTVDLMYVGDKAKPGGGLLLILKDANEVK